MIARIEARGRDCGSRACGACRRQLHAPCPCKEISRGKLSLEDHSFVQESHSPCVLPPALGAIHKIQGDVVVHERALPGHLKRLSARHVHAPHGLSQGVLPFPSDRLGVASQKGRRLGFSIAVPRNEASFRGGIQIAHAFGFYLEQSVWWYLLALTWLLTSAGYVFFFVVRGWVRAA